MAGPLGFVHGSRGIASHEGSLRRAERLQDAAKIPLERLNPADKRVGIAVRSRHAEQRVRVEVGNEVDLAHHVAKFETEVPESGFARAEFPVPVLGEKFLSFLSPHRPEVQKLGAEFGEFPDAAAARRISQRARAVFPQSCGVKIQGDEPLEGIPDEGEREILRVEVKNPGRARHSFGKQPAAPVRIYDVRRAVVSGEIVLDGAAPALGHLDVNASVFMRYHGVAREPRSGPPGARYGDVPALFGPRAPKAPARALPQVGYRIQPPLKEGPGETGNGTRWLPDAESGTLGYGFRPSRRGVGFTAGRNRGPRTREDRKYD